MVDAGRLDATSAAALVVARFTNPRSAEAREMQARWQARHRQGAGEVPTRCRRGAGEVQARCRRGARRVQARCTRGARGVHAGCTQGARGVHARCAPIVVALIQARLPAAHLAERKQIDAIDV